MNFLWNYQFFIYIIGPVFRDIRILSSKQRVNTAHFCGLLPSSSLLP